VHTANFAFFRYNQEAIRFSRRRKHVLEKDLVLPLPDTRLIALKHTIDYPQRIIRVEAAG
jgi:hypothetical protein